MIYWFYGSYFLKWLVLHLKPIEYITIKTPTNKTTTTSTRWHLKNPNSHLSSLRAWNMRQPQSTFTQDHLVVTNMQFDWDIKSLLSNLIAFISSTTCSLKTALCITVWRWWDYSPNKAERWAWSVPHQVVWWLQCCGFSLWAILSRFTTPF